MSRKRFGLLSVSAVVMALLLVACGADPTATPTSAPTATAPAQAAPTPTPDAAALFQAEWAALIAAAQAEGEVVLTFGGSAGRNFRPVAAVFEEKFGVKTVIATGSGSAHVNRVLAEQTSGRYLVDAMYGGATSVNTRLIPANALDPIAEEFIHPEVLDQSLWFEGRHWYADPGQKFIFAFAAVPEPMTLGVRYNTDLVSQEDVDGLNSVWDYLEPKWKDKIVSLNPTAGGSGGTYYTVYVHPDIGREWIAAFFSPELGVTFSDSRSFIIDGVAKGKFHMGLGGALTDLDALAGLGAPVKRLLKDFKEGGELAASSSLDLITVPINRPNPNASKLWVNWWLSQEGQTLMQTLAEIEPEPTLRLDVTDWGKTAENLRRVEGKTYFFFDADPELVSQRLEAAEYTAQLFNSTR